jgi:modified peptide precursor CbpA
VLKKGRKVIAYRRTCESRGVGLSHYILIEKKAK